MAELFSICRVLCPSECGLNVVPLQLRVFDIFAQIGNMFHIEARKIPKIGTSIKMLSQFLNQFPNLEQYNGSACDWGHSLMAHAQLAHNFTTIWGNL